MIDHSDSDDFFLLGLLTPGWGALLFILIACALSWVAYNNEGECAEKTCPVGMTVRLMENSCMCVIEAKETT